MTQAAHDVNTAHSRRWLYGMNLLLLVLVALMILVMVMIVVDRYKSRAQWDISSNAVNSLSGSSKKLLKEITDRKQNFHLVSLFTDPSNEEKSRGDTSQSEKRRQVMDLLNLYAKNSPNVQVDDWGDRARDEIEKEIRDKYATELKPYEQAVQEFDGLAKQMREFSSQEAEQIAAALQKVPEETVKPEEKEIAQGLQSQFRSVPAKLDDLQRDIHRRSDSTLPEWNEITRDIREVVDNFDGFLQNFSDPQKVKEIHFPPALDAYFTAATPRYQKLAAEVHAYLEKLKGLQSLKVQDVLTGVGRNTIVVLGPDSAKVLSRWDIFDTSSPADPSSPPASVFKGEEVISSALLAMARPEKVKVVFVTGSPQRITSDSAPQAYANMSRILEEANFDVLEWSPPGAPAPDQPPASADPPAQGKGVVWLVFPPDQQSPQMMMMGGPPPNAKPLIDATQKHLSLGGQVLFFAEASAGNPLTGGGEKYAYDDLLQPFGIEVKSKFTAVQLTDSVAQATGVRTLRYAPYLEITHYEDHEITTPIQSLPSAFFPGKAVTVVDVARNPPAGVEPKVIVRTPNAPDYWGEADFDATPPKYDPQTDLAAPVPLVAVSIKDKGKPDEQRVMVMGTKFLGANTIFEAVEPAMINGQLVGVPRFPGNVELMRNSVLWLAGYENMIAVSSKANAGSRLTVSSAGLTMMRVGLGVLAPGLVLALGILVWVVRHR